MFQLSISPQIFVNIRSGPNNGLLQSRGKLTHEKKLEGENLVSQSR